MGLKDLEKSYFRSGLRCLFDAARFVVAFRFSAAAGEFHIARHDFGEVARIRRARKAKAVTPREHAARLQIMRNLAGMLNHPQSDEVMSAGSRKKIEAAFQVLLSATPMSAAELATLRALAPQDYVVKWSDGKSKKVFAYASSRAQ